MKPVLEPGRSELQHRSLAVFEVSSPYPWSWHFHPEIELTWIREGRGTRLVGDHSAPFEPDDLVLIGPNLPHTWFSSGGRSCPNAAVVAQFRMFPEALLALPEFAPISGLLARASQGVSFSGSTGRRIGTRLRRLLQENGLPSWLKLANLLGDLAACHDGEPLASKGYWNKGSHQIASRLERVMAHIDLNFRDDLPLADAAQIAGLTPSAFSRFFKKMTRKTFVDYRTFCRVRAACSLLEETDLSIAEIAYDCGFGNLANFNRRFLREKRLTPGQFRRLRNPSSNLPAP